MRERGRKNRTSATMLAGWKKAVVLMLALIMCISSIVVPQPEEVSAKQATYIDYFGEDQPKNQIVFATSDDAKWHKTQEHCCNISTYRHYHCIKKKTVYAGEKFTIIPVAMFKNGVVVGSKNSKDGIKSGELKYKSSNTSIATVNAKGKVTGKKAGSAMITVKAKDGSGKKAICKVVVTAPATTAKKNPTTATTRSQTKRVTAPVTSGNSTVSSSVPAASGTTKKLPSGNSGNSAKAATGTTAKKKKTAAEETTGGWSFSGDNYVPDTNSAESEDEVAQEDTETSDTGSKKEGIKWMVIFYIIGGVVVGVLVFVLYKKRHAIAGVLKKFGRGGDTE